MGGGRYSFTPLWTDEGMNVLFRLTQAFLFILPFQVALSPFSGVDLPISRIFSIILAVVYLTVSLSRRKVWIPFSPEALLLYSFLFFSLLSLLWAENTAWAIRRSTYFLTFLPLFIIYTSLLKEARRSLYRLAVPFVVGAGIAGLVGLFEFASQYIFSVPVVFNFWITTILPVFLGESFSASVAAYPSLLVNVGGATILRASAFFPDPHMAAFYFGISFPIAIYCYYESAVSSKKAVFGIIAIIVLIADVLTFSRGGYVGLLSGLIVAMSWYVSTLHIHHKNRLFLAVLVCMIVVGSLTVAPVRSRVLSVFSTEDGSNLGRIEMYSEAIRNITKQPWGYGLGNYSLAVKPTAEFREPIYAHNIYLDIATESGIPGALCVILALVSVLYRLIRRKDAVAYMGLVALSVFIGHSLFETPLYSVHVFPVFLLLLALPYADRKNGSPVEQVCE